MDPVGGPWYASYNRLTTPTSAFQTSGLDQTLLLASATGTPDATNAVATSSTNAPQIILQTTHTPSPFNPGSFLSTPTAVGYDVFSPFFQNSKQTATTQYVTQPVRTVSNSKPSSPEEDSDIPSLRSNYASPQQSESYFDRQTSATSPAAGWSLTQPTSQVTSPFGILPHESVAVASPPGPPTSKPTGTYDSSPFSVSHFNINGTADTSKTNAWSTDSSKKNGDESPTFFQSTTAFEAEGLAYSPTNNTVAHQSCIVTAPSVTATNRVTQLPRGVAPTTIYLTTTPQDKQTVVTGNHDQSGPDQSHDSSQSSPISFSLMDSRNLNYNGSKQTTTGVQYHVLNQTQQNSCQLYSTATTTANSESEYHHPARSKSAASTDSAYSSNTSQNGPDCAVVVPRRPSPLQGHSQASPLGHVPSPATYPMYNSPMATMSSPSPLQPQHSDTSTPYKSNSAQQQMTPPSPLDMASTRSPSSQQGQVVYSSVITRALGTNETNKNYNAEGANASFDRNQEFVQSKQLCNWDSDNQQQSAEIRKFPTASYLAPDNAEANVLTSHHMQRLLDVTDRPSCLETSTINLQDLRCRGEDVEDENNCQQIAQKSNNYHLERVPPRAHNQVILNQPSTQQQNGYIDLDRWNLAPLQNAKIISTTPNATAFVQQPAQVVQTANLVSTNPTLLVAASPSVSYFPTFHITQSTPHITQLQQQHHQNVVPELQHTIEISTLNLPPDMHGCEQNTSITYNSVPRDDRPQVIVPDIEEELGFLQQPDFSCSTSAIQPTTQQHAPVPTEPKKSTNNEPNSGFMTSYLKFLQGEKDNSPPPSIITGRRSTWNQRRSYVHSSDRNGTMSETSQANTTSDKQKESGQTETIDYANDPRYFPLPKERKQDNFDSSDDGFSSDSELNTFNPQKRHKDNSCQVESNQHQQEQYQQVQGTTNSYGLGPALPIKAPEGRPRKGRPIKPGGPTDRKRKAAVAAAEAAAKGLPYPPTKNKKKKDKELPRRESSRRKAKEKPKSESEGPPPTADPYEMDEEGDSDSDPAWTPVKPAEEDAKNRKRGRPPVISKRYNNKYGEYTDMPPQHQQNSKRTGRKKKNHVEAVRIGCKIDEKLLASISDEDIDISPFQSGEFVVIKTDLDQEYPPLWRIDGKTLLQKYEPFQADGKTLYRNISTYSGWAPQNRYIYQSVPVKFWQQNKMETIVEFLRDEMLVNDCESISKFMKETEKYQDNFEVYIQTLISQALDSNFLTEIFQEQDDYFLLNVKTVDEVTEERKQRLLSTTNWRHNVVTALSTWPCINVLNDNLADYKGKSCAGCGRVKIFSRVLLYGQPYNSTTLEGSPPDPQVPQEKDFLFCRVCQTKVGLFNKVAHQKYLMFLECARRVAEKRVADPHKDTTIILNELLADETWLNQLFKEVRGIWAEIDSIQEKARKKADQLAAESISKLQKAESERQQQLQEQQQQQLHHHQQQQQQHQHQVYNNDQTNVVGYS